MEMTETADQGGPISRLELMKLRSVQDSPNHLANIERRPIIFRNEAQEVFWGGYSGYFADPDGHLWEVAYPALTSE